MAIQINKEILFNGNIKLNSCYVRLSLTLNKNGVKIFIDGDFFQSKETYKIDINNHSFLNPYFVKDTTVDYNYSVDGDLISYSHNKYVEYLTTNQYHDVIIKLRKYTGSTSDLSINIKDSIYTIIDDQKTIYHSTVNEIYYDGNDFYERVLIRPKIFEPTDVSIVDLD